MMPLDDEIELYSFRFVVNDNHCLASSSAFPHSEAGISHSFPSLGSRENADGAATSDHKTAIQNREAVRLPTLRRFSDRGSSSHPYKLSLPAPLLPGSVLDEHEADPNEGSLEGQESSGTPPPEASAPPLSPSTHLASDGTFVDADQRDHGQIIMSTQQHDPPDPAMHTEVLSPIRVSTHEIPDMDVLPGGASPTASGAASSLLQSIKNGIKKMTAQVCGIIPCLLGM
jgi:hypothetical protein